MEITIPSDYPNGSQKIVIKHSAQLLQLEHSATLQDALTNHLQVVISEKINISHGELESDSSSPNFRLKLFNTKGITVRHYLVKQQPAGHYTVSFLALTIHPATDQ